MKKYKFVEIDLITLAEFLSLSQFEDLYVLEDGKYLMLDKFDSFSLLELSYTKFYLKEETK